MNLRVPGHDELLPITNLPGDAGEMYREIWVDRWYEREPKCQIPHGGIVVDIGANIGVFALKAAARGCRVIAYEPEPQNFAALAENLEGKGAVRNLAVSDHTGEDDFWITSVIGGHTVLNLHRGDIWQKIPCVSLDSIIYGLVQIHDGPGPELFVKIDAEGAEYKIFMGASDDCLLLVDKLVMEFHDELLHRFFPTFEATLFERFAELGFQQRKTPLPGGLQSIWYLWREGVV